ncbi:MULTISPECIES: site-2 protease family protein [Methylobacillus]|uniref:Peptidase M50 n=1 Tax=Methylobacillus flagellatus (strain ATCC 51484 / DSM 6875 / VKM B-1610 / KT) TaxID=265072 RepID=Q1H045_METFK|nr:MULTISPECIES: site-2 protease family protein [Methylobacillus]ABE50142.1 peptidase M50 [Methylobacillus flagellatus KT]MPS48628.1 site-2 protease family protein [Methylobacillus sp.]
MELTLIQKIAIYALPVVFAITVHEAAHGYIARYFGDTTAESLGRITLNPIKHIDPIGTILVPALLVFSGTGFLFGWAKPVPVDYARLRNPKHDMRWVAAAGPASNFLMAIFWAMVYKLGASMSGDFAMPLSLMGQAGILVNVVLMVLNLLPLPPLDGGRIAVSLMPNHMAYKFAQVERYGFIILLVLMFTGILSKIMMPFIMILLAMFAGIFS